MDDGTGTSWQPSLTAVSPAQTLIGRAADGHLLSTIREINTSIYNRLGAIITRLDGQKDVEPDGTYTLELHRGEGGIDR